MVNHKWIHLYFEPGILRENKSFEIIVYSDENKKFYFFGNAIFWILGYDEPHVALQQHVPPDKQHKIDLGSGIFLDEKTVNRLLGVRIKENIPFRTFDRIRRFKDWFVNYLTICKGKNPNIKKNTCPY